MNIKNFGMILIISGLFLGCGEDNISTEKNRNQMSLSMNDGAEYENKLEEFVVFVDSCDLDTPYEKKQCRETLEQSKYKFTGEITDILSKNEFTMKIASWEYVDVKGNFNIDDVLKIHKSGKTVTIVGVLTHLGSGYLFSHDAKFIGFY